MTCEKQTLLNSCRRSALQLQRYYAVLWYTSTTQLSCESRLHWELDYQCGMGPHIFYHDRWNSVPCDKPMSQHACMRRNVQTISKSWHLFHIRDQYIFTASTGIDLGVQQEACFTKQMYGHGMVWGRCVLRRMKLTYAGRTLSLILLLSGLAGLALAKQAYIFDELAWTKQSWTDMKLRFPIEGLLREEDFGSYEAISSKGTYSRSSLPQTLEEGQVQHR